MLVMRAHDHISCHRRARNDDSLRLLGTALHTDEDCQGSQSSVISRRTSESNGVALTRRCDLQLDIIAILLTSPSRHRVFLVGTREKVWY